MTTKLNKQEADAQTETGAGMAIEKESGTANESGTASTTSRRRQKQRACRMCCGWHSVRHSVDLNLRLRRRRSGTRGVQPVWHRAPAAAQAQERH